MYPLLVAASPIVALYSQNVGYTQLGELLLPLLGSSAFAVVAVLLFWLLMRDVYKASLAASVVAFLFFTYGPVREVVSRPLGPVLLSNWKILPFVAVGALLLVAAISRSGRDFRRSVGPLNIVAASLLLVSLVTAGVQVILGHLRSRTPGTGAIELDSETRPDIYHVIVDGFGRPDVMLQRFDLDLSGFVERMKRRGVYVAERSVANYPFSLASISSTLNMEYHDALVERMSAKSTDPRPYLALLADSRVVNTLRQHGYTFVSFASGWVGTDSMRPDVFQQSGVGLTEFQQQVLRMTPANAFAGVLVRDWVYGVQRERILSAFDRLPALAEDERPTYALAHVMAPHQPFVFDETGDLPRGGSLALLGDPLGRHPERERRLLVAQTSFISRKVEEVVEAILARSPEPPIILIHSDHGPNSQPSREYDAEERLPILNCYYLPGEGAERLYPSITPVNSMRLVLSHYLGADLELLPDRSYMVGADALYDMHEVEPDH